MCGITGIWNFKEPIKKDTLLTFTNSISHRGMDDFGHGLYLDRRLGLGHRRLSILDLSENGRQPMEFGGYSIVFNGEIFNFQELKNELISLGYQFQTETDTEVLLAAYKQWGEQCLDKLNGMWAFAIFDQSKEELFLCGDRFGIKPCYFSYDENEQFAFASETLAFGNLEGFKKVVNSERLNLNLKDEYALEPLGFTIYEGIYRLLPGHYIRIKKGKIPQQERWYDIRDKVSNLKIPYNEAVKTFKELFKDSCRIRLRSDVPIATALSGGLDSSAVYGQIKELIKEGDLGERIPTNIHQAFTMTFPHWEKDESAFAKKVLDFYQEEGSFAQVNTSSIVSDVEHITQKSDFITTNPLLPIYQIYASMKKSGATVSMDGHGADELMFGYKTMLWELHEIFLKTNQKSKVKDLEMYLLKTYEPSKRSEIQAYLKNRHSIKSKITSRLKQVMSYHKKEMKLKSLSNKPYDFNHGTLEEICLNYFFERTLPPILRNFDKASMLAGVEVRMPFMDYRLVEFCFSLPYHFMVDSKFNKLILREAVKGIIPEDIRTRILKYGFQSPIAYWLDNELAEWASQIENTESYKRLFSSPVKGISPEIRWKRLNAVIILGR